MTPKNVFFGMIGLLVLTVLAGLAMFYYSDQNLSSSSVDIKRLKAEVDVLEDKITAINEANIQLNEYSDVQEKIESVLPPNKIQSDIVAQIFKLADQNGITLDAINFPTSSNTNNFDTSQTQPLPGVNGVRFTTINTDFTANYGTVLRFLDDIAKNQRLMQTSSLTINPSTGNQFSVGIELQIFVRG